MRNRLLAALAITFAASRTPGAVCVVLPLDQQPHVAVAFRGTVVDVESVPAGQVVTFEVDRVWKGQVTRRFVIYNATASPHSETVTFSRGQRQFVTAYQHTREDRVRFGIDGLKHATYGTRGCDSYPADSPYVEDTVGPARGRAVN